MMAKRKRKRGRNKYAYKLILLTRGLVVVVSPEDFERVRQYRWSPVTTKGVVHSVAAIIEGKNVKLHRFILGLSSKDKRVVDHWNMCIFDNRRCNLRVCTRRENGRNSKRWRPYGYSGVVRDTTITGERGGKPFVVIVHVGSKTIYPGRFETAKLAARRYDAVVRKELGELAKFARLNFPRRDELPPKPPRKIAKQVPLPTNRWIGNRGRVSKYVGVCMNGERWFWQAQYVGKRYKEYGFSTELAAAKARDAFIIEKGLPNTLNFPKRKRRKSHEKT